MKLTKIIPYLCLLLLIGFCSNYYFFRTSVRVVRNVSFKVVNQRTCLEKTAIHYVFLRQRRGICGKIINITFDNQTIQAIVHQETINKDLIGDNFQANFLYFNGVLEIIEPIAPKEFTDTVYPLKFKLF